MAPFVFSQIMNIHMQRATGKRFRKLSIRRNRLLNLGLKIVISHLVQSAGHWQDLHQALIIGGLIAVAVLVARWHDDHVHPLIFAVKGVL